MSDTSNNWTFDGIIQDVTTKTTKGGKRFYEIVASRQDGQYERLCVCTKWGELASDVINGAEVHMEGRIDGREYNGRHYAGLTVFRVEVRGVRTDAQPATQPPTNPTPQAERTDAGRDEKADDLPF